MQALPEDFMPFRDTYEFLLPFIPNGQNSPEKLIKLIMKMHTYFTKEPTLALFKDYLKRYKELILLLHGLPKDSSTFEQSVTYEGICTFFGNKADSTIGCKTNAFRDRKKEICEYLTMLVVKYIEYIKIVNPDLLRDRKEYINELYKAIQYFCYFISFKELTSIYEYVDPLLTQLNALYPPDDPILMDRCYPPTNRGYGCFREITIVKRLAPPHHDVILLLSTNNEGLGDIQEGTNLDVQGSKKSMRKKRRTKIYFSHRRASIKKSSWHF